MPKCLICNHDMSQEFDVTGDGWRDICIIHGTVKEQEASKQSAAGVMHEVHMRSLRQHRKFCESALQQLDVILKTVDGVGLILHQQPTCDDPWGSPETGNNESGESLLQTTKKQLAALVAQTKKELEYEPEERHE